MSVNNNELEPRCFAINVLFNENELKTTSKMNGYLFQGLFQKHWVCWTIATT